ncbi:voltage-gated ion channel protein, putative, partial [Bodo saltans]
MALERVIEQNQNPWRVKVREALFPYTVPGAKRTMSTLGKYEGLMFVLYVVNMVILALPGGYDEPDGEKTMTLKGFELFFTVVYFFEIALSGLAFGFLDLLHPVRLVDFLLVAANLAILIGFYLGNLSWRFSLLPVRCSLRILRPFFVTTEFPNVRLFVVSVARSIMQLTDVTLLFIFFLLLEVCFKLVAVSDFYSFATLPESSAINFFGAPSTLSWNSSKLNSTLNTLSLDMTYSSIIPVHSVFGTIITSTNVSEKMLVEALYTFSSSFISYYPQGLYDYICASDYLLTGDLATNLATALTDPEYTPPQQKRYVRRSVRSAPKKRENLTFTGTGTVYPATFTQSASHSPS